jgi:hypothetical protein
VNCNQQLCIELLSVIRFHRETEPTSALQYALHSLAEKRGGYQLCERDE